MQAFDCEFYENRAVRPRSSLSPEACVMIISGQQGRARVLMERCSFYHNSVREEAGVVYLNGGSAGAQGPSELTLTNCTLAENATVADLSDPSRRSGAIRVETGGILSVHNSTIVDNLGFGIVVDQGQVELRESILAGNREADGSLSNLSGSLTSLGGNLTDENLETVFNRPFDQVQADPKLSSLGYNGGKVLTCYPLAGSDAIDGGDPNRASSGPVLDGRGFERIASTASLVNRNPIDIGAVEIRTNEDLVVATTADSAGTSLRAALNAAAGSGVSGRRITFSPTLNGREIGVFSALEWSAAKHLNIDASDLPDGLNIKITGEDDILRLSNSASLTFHNVRFTGYQTSSTNSNNGLNPIRMLDKSSLGLNCVTFENNEGPFGGGVQTRSSGRIHLTGCQFTNNRATTFGGGALRIGQNADGILAQIWKSSFVDNRATSLGSAVLTFQGFLNRLEMRNCVFHGNDSNGTGSCLEVTSVADISFCTFASNTASRGAIRISNTPKPVRVSDCLFKDNVNTSGGDDENDFSLNFFTDPPETLRCFTTNSDNSKNFFPEPENTFGVQLPLAELDLHGGKLLILPLLGNNPAIDSGNSDYLRATDINGDIGTVDGLPNAGAVEAFIDRSKSVTVLEVIHTGRSLMITFQAERGSRWKFEESKDLGKFSEVEGEIIATGGRQVQTLSIPTNPAPEKYFFRFVPLDDR